MMPCHFRYLVVIPNRLRHVDGVGESKKHKGDCGCLSCIIDAQRLVNGGLPSPTPKTQ